MQRRNRLLFIVVFLAGVAVLCVHYGGVYDRNWPHPSGAQLADEPGGWDGEQVLLFGTVTETTEEGFVMAVKTASGDTARILTVYKDQTEAKSGGLVQVYGELSNRGTIQHAESVVVVNEGPDDSQYKLSVSAVGILVAAGAFLRYWGIDWHRLQFYTRAQSGDDDG
ncbi:DNA-binding protein [Halovenus rubra]|uniref:DNA-binding protein n=2 Tax=Halovenus rubra TaxID=869890 RepID=A0ABD5XCR8_9EURY|nr:hypothetical protein [Halovenus rubra]